MARDSAEGSPTAGLEQARRRRGPDPVRVILLLVILGLAIAFIVQNREPVKIQLWFVTVHMTLVWVVIVALLVGALIEVLLRRQIRHRWRARRERGRQERAQRA